MLFFAVILYIFLDGVYQFAIFIRECVGSAFAQYVIIRFGDTDVERAFSSFGGYILDDCEVDLQFNDVFHLFGCFASFVGSLDVDVRSIQLSCERNLFIQVFLFFGKVADLL